MNVQLLTMFCTLCAVTCDVIKDQADDFVADDTVVEIFDKESFLKISKDDPFVLLCFNSQDEDCVRCKSVLKVLKEIGKAKGITLYTASSDSLTKAFSITSSPSLVYVRHGEPILYEGDFGSVDMPEEIETWVETTARVCTKDLNDETFEHLTQASTGATTGDWLVLFFSPECDQMIAVLDTVCYSTRHRMNVARVNLHQNPETKLRFSPKTCSQLLFFRHGKMYRYEVDDHKPSSLVNFVTSWYTNSKAEFVPLLQSPFDKLVEDIARNIKTQMHGPNRPIIIAASIATLVVMATIARLLCKSRRRRRDNEHED